MSLVANLQSIFVVVFLKNWPKVGLAVDTVFLQKVLSSQSVHLQNVGIIFSIFRVLGGYVAVIFEFDAEKQDTNCGPSNHSIRRESE